MYLTKYVSSSNWKGGADFGGGRKRRFAFAVV